MKKTGQFAANLGGQYHRFFHSSIKNYYNTRKLLRDFTLATCFPLSLSFTTVLKTESTRKQIRYWKKLYTRFTNYLFYKRKCHDNYVGSVCKCLRAFLRYLHLEKFPSLADGSHCFYVHHEEIPVQVLSTERLRFLALDKKFSLQLSQDTARSKDRFVFGCCTALRFSDLNALRVLNIARQQDASYLRIKSIKTGHYTSLLLTPWAAAIASIHMQHKPPQAPLFRPISLHQYNQQLKKIAKLAGWNEPVEKYRSRKGKISKSLKNNPPSFQPFWKLMSSHMMRRTAITTLLLAGIPEPVVRKISGHSPSSTAFYRYVQYTQPFLDAKMLQLSNELTDHQLPMTN